MRAGHLNLTNIDRLYQCHLSFRISDVVMMYVDDKFGMKINKSSRMSDMSFKALSVVWLAK